MIDDALTAHFATLLQVAGTDMRYQRLDDSFTARMVLARRRQDVEDMQKSASISAKIVDLLVRQADFKLGEPQRGDRIHMQSGRNFEVRSQPNLPCWEWSDPRHTFMRVHTIEQVTVLQTVPAVTSYVIGDGTAQRSIVDSITVRFDGEVEIQPGAFVLTHRTSGALIATSFTESLGVAVVEFSGTGTHGRGALDDGYYELTIRSHLVTRDGLPMANDVVVGSVQSDGFFALYGDTNGDGIVGVAEFGQFRSTFGKSSDMVGFNPLLDYEQDGTVGVSDFGQFRSRFGKPQLQF